MNYCTREAQYRLAYHEHNKSHSKSIDEYLDQLE